MHISKREHLTHGVGAVESGNANLHIVNHGAEPGMRGALALRIPFRQSDHSDRNGEPGVDRDSPGRKARRGTMSTLVIAA